MADFKYYTRDKAGEIEAEAGLLIYTILGCEAERVASQISGFDTGFEHPNTRLMFSRCVERAKSLRKTMEDPK